MSPRRRHCERSRPTNGAAGSIARYQVAAMVQARVAAGFPWGTFIVNMSGCFVMGVVMTLLTEPAAAYIADIC